MGSYDKVLCSGERSLNIIKMLDFQTIYIGMTTLIVTFG